MSTLSRSDTGPSSSTFHRVVSASVINVAPQGEAVRLAAYLSRHRKHTGIRLALSEAEFKKPRKK
eukprot:161366-Pleurochrysis_carterae.AAC.5